MPADPASAAIQSDLVAGEVQSISMPFLLPPTDELTD